MIPAPAHHQSQPAIHMAFAMVCGVASTLAGCQTCNLPAAWASRCPQPDMRLWARPGLTCHQPDMRLWARPGLARHQPDMWFRARPGLTCHQPDIRLWARPNLTMVPAQCLAVGLATACPSAQPCHPHLCFKRRLGVHKACLQDRIFCGFGPGPGCLHCPTGTLLC